MRELRTQMESLKKDELWFRLMELGERAGCHQRADRSFFIGGCQFPLCARCTGVFLGQLSAVVMLIFRKALSPVLSLVLLLVMGADWFIQRIGVLESDNIRRLITGIMGGAGIIFLYFHIAAALFKALKVLK